MNLPSPSWVADRDLLVRFERLGVSAWPALETAPIGDWLWRWSQSGSQRANSVACLGDPGLPLKSAIEAAERMYRARSGAAMFQVSTLVSPAGVDEELAARGYTVRDPCTWMACDLTAPLPEPSLACRSADAPDDGWLATYLSVISPDRRERAPAVIARIPAPRRFCSATIGRQTVATALIVVDGPVAVVECVATRADARRTGAGSAVMHAALAAARELGVRTAALGVVSANVPAVSLYSRLGFVPFGGYHYRRRD